MCEIKIYNRDENEKVDKDIFIDDFTKVDSAKYFNICGYVVYN
ncbi:MULTISPECIES: hypothetical protein [Clostridium]|nr:MULTISPECIES: hypothetical protein [Clostridium]